MRRSPLSALPNTDAQSSHRVTLGLGGNLGDPPVAMAKALQHINRHDAIEIEAVSRLYRTPPWGNTDQDWFYNCCAVVVTTLKPRVVLDICLDIEKLLKRRRKERWGPRIIDIDILTYDEETVDEEGLTLPHPHMHVRAFVLVPLREIAADVKVAGRTVSQWAQSCDDDGIEIAGPGTDWWLRAQPS